MNAHAQRAAEVEDAFLAGVERNLNLARGNRLPGTQWAWTTRSQEDRLRELMAERQQHDREVLRAMPKNRARVLTGSRPGLLFGRRRTMVAIAAVLSPLEHYLDEEGPPPLIGPVQVGVQVKELTGRADVPYLVGVCSPSGFTPEARAGNRDWPNVTLILVEPRDQGGWTVIAVSPGATDEDCRLFDPETTEQKLRRVREELGARRGELATGGLSAAVIGERLGLPVELVVDAFEEAARTDRELKVSRGRSNMLLFRGAPAALEDSQMSIADRLRRLFSGKGQEARKIGALSERRAKLVERRDRLYTDLAQLEKREGELLEEGREGTSPAVKRRVASQIKHLRDDMGRLNATAGMLNQQVSVISTHIHNLTLIQQGQMAKLPTTEEMTQDAVRAEEMIEQLGAEAELAGSLGMGVSQSLTSDEELAILKELDEPAAPKPEMSKPHAARADAAPEPRVEPEEPQRREAEAG